MRLGEAHDLILGDVCAIDAIQIFQNHLFPVWQPSVDEPAAPRRLNHFSHAQRDRRRRRRGVRERDVDCRDQMASEHDLGSRRHHDLRCTIVVTCNRKIHRRNDIERSLTGKQFEASFFGRKPRGQAGGPAWAVAGVSQLLCRKKLAKVAGQCLDQALYPDDINRIDCAAIWKTICIICHGGAATSGNGAQQQRTVGSRKATTQHQQHSTARRPRLC